MSVQLNIWIFQTGEPLHIDGENPRPMRAMNLCDSLIKKGHRVILWSSTFYHQEKHQRCLKNQTFQVSDNLEIRLIHSPGYNKNIGIGRLVDHALLAMNLKKVLNAEKNLPDVAFIGYPPIESAAILTRWLKCRGVKSVLDVKDQWPSIFIDTLPTLLRPVGSVVFWPYFYYARRAMQDATGLSAMANDFLDWALSFAGRPVNKHDGVFPLTAPIYQMPEEELQRARQWWDERGVKKDDKARFCFVGSISPGFDFTPIKDAAMDAEVDGKNMQFIICGEGGSTSKVKAMMSGLSNVIFPGWIDRPKIMVLAERCIAALAPYLNSSDFKMSIPNKIIDAMSLGLPVVSPLQGEVADLITEHAIGVRYGYGTEMTLYDSISRLIQDPVLQKSISKNAKALYEEQFSFEIVYSSLVSHLEMLAASK